jgi:hypothetical protein
VVNSPGASLHSSVGAHPACCRMASAFVEATSGPGGDGDVRTQQGASRCTLSKIAPAIAVSVDIAAAPPRI